ncbi:MAG: class I SAM-dependent methyltransferase [Candidatus Thorarchaeota archaeon]
MTDYYSAQLSAERLKRCYEIAPPRIVKYLEAELDFVAGRIRPFDIVLELGCGYGRALHEICKHAGDVIGIDTSMKNLTFGLGQIVECESVNLLQMNALDLAFDDNVFDVVACIQNGISAFGVDPVELVRESLRVTRRSGLCLFSSYSNKIWEERLEWFTIQSEEGLVGEIDWNMTSKGRIVCKDGFEATTLGPGDFREISAKLGVESYMIEIDESSVFCCIEKI